MSPRADRAPRPLSEGGLIALIGLFLMLQPLATDMYIASLPGIARRLDAAAATVQLTLSVFALAFALMQLVSGPLSDRFGRRPVVLAGLALFAASSLACAAAPTIEWLIAARAFQAIGCCTAVVVARGIVRDAFTAEAGARAVARASSLLAIGPIVGPILGSVLEVAYGFRAAFVLMAAGGVALFGVTYARLPETNLQRDARATRPERVVRNYAQLLRSREFLSYAALGSASYAGLFALISGSPLVMIRVLGMPTAWFGTFWAVGVSGYLLGTLACRRSLGRHGIVATVRTGAWLAGAGGILFLAVALADVRLWGAILAAQFLYFGAHGILFPCALAGVVAPFPRQAGAAAGLFGCLAMAIAAPIGVAVGAAIVDSSRPLAIAVAGAAAVALAVARFALRGR